MVREGWTAIALPDEVVERVDEARKKNRAYRSRQELVKALTLKGLDEMEKGSA